MSSVVRFCRLHALLIFYIVCLQLNYAYIVKQKGHTSDDEQEETHDLDLAR